MTDLIWWRLGIVIVVMLVLASATGWLAVRFLVNFAKFARSWSKRPRLTDGKRRTRRPLRCALGWHVFRKTVRPRGVSVRCARCDAYWDFDFQEPPPLREQEAGRK